MDTQPEPEPQPTPATDHERAHRLAARLAGRTTARAALIEAARRKLESGKLDAPEVLDAVAGRLSARLGQR